jgi:DtxR family Mn-dependent transcriptional regulator
MKRDTTEESIGIYVTAVLLLSETAQEPGRVRTSALANFLGIAPASVCQMIQKLSGRPLELLLYKRSAGVCLSAAGRVVALAHLRRTQLLCCYLFEELGFSREELWAEASRLSSHISSRFEQKLAHKLGYPLVDPYGRNIPEQSKHPSWS